MPKATTTSSATASSSFHVERSCQMGRSSEERVVGDWWLVVGEEAFSPATNNQPPTTFECQDAPMYYLEITDASGRRRRVELTRPRLLIGREPTCDICLPHPPASRLHANF